MKTFLKFVIFNIKGVQTTSGVRGKVRDLN